MKPCFTTHFFKTHKKNPLWHSFSNLFFWNDFSLTWNTYLAFFPVYFWGNCRFLSMLYWFAWLWRACMGHEKYLLLFIKTQKQFYCPAPQPPDSQNNGTAPSFPCSACNRAHMHRCCLYKVLIWLREDESLKATVKWETVAVEKKNNTDFHEQPWRNTTVRHILLLGRACRTNGEVLRSCLFIATPQSYCLWLLFENIVITVCCTHSICNYQELCFDFLEIQKVNQSKPTREKKLLSTLITVNFTIN